MISIDRCPICDSDKLEKMSRVVYSRPFVPVSYEGVQFMMSALVGYSRCSECHVYIQSPRMSDGEIAHYYAEGIYRKWLNTPQEALDLDELMRASDDAAFLNKLIGRPASHLDIGSSRGEFLRLMNSPAQAGVEPNAGYNQNASAYIVPRLEDVTGEFELVSMIHSLEHSTDPMRDLGMAVDRSSRWIVVEVPSEQSKGGWGRLAHTFHFPDETLIYMAESLSCETRLVHHNPHTFILMEKIQADGHTQ